MAIGRPRGFDRDAALHAAMLVFWRKGFLAASMNDLCDGMGIRSPSLYAAFGDKESLYLEAMQHYAETIGTAVWGRLLEAPTARAGVEALLQAAVDTLPADGVMPAGCMAFLGALGEECPVAVSDAPRQLRLDCLRRLRQRLGEAVDTGELPSADVADRLGRFYVGIYQALAVQARDGATAAELSDLADMAMSVWPAAPGARPRGHRSGPGGAKTP